MLFSSVSFSQKIDTLNLNKFQKSPVLSLLPSVSWSQNMGINIGFSLSNISRFFQQKRRNEIEIDRYIDLIKERQIRESEKVLELLLKFEVDIDNILAYFEVLKIEAQIFELDEAQYLAKEITTEEFLPKKLKWFKSYNSLISRCKALYLRGLKISNKTPLPQLNDLDTLINLLKGKNFGGLGAAPPSSVTKKTAIAGGLAVSYGLSLQAAPINPNLLKNVECPKN